MSQWRLPLTLFFLAVLIPFAASLGFFLVSARHSLLTTPREHIELLKRDGRTTTLVALGPWKEALAQDDVCRTARAIVIGSSRLREVDERVTGTSTCNLYVDGLATGQFMRLAGALPPRPRGDVPVVYVGVDHFWLWSADADEVGHVATSLADRSPALWKAWQVGRTLGFFQWRDLVEAVRRYRLPPPADDEITSVWYPDGHLENPLYYKRKHAGQHQMLTHAMVEADVATLFAGGTVNDANVERLGAAVRLLHSKGYAVRLFWNPVSPGHITAARQHFGAVFQQAIDAVDREARLLPLDRYLPAARTMDPRTFGCADIDYFDSTHVDVDCLGRLFSAALRDNLPAPTRPDVTAVALTPK
jgi:hypothetical protein